LTFVKNQEVLAPGYVALSTPQKSAVEGSFTKYTIQPKPKPKPTPKPTPSPTQTTDTGTTNGSGNGGFPTDTGTGGSGTGDTGGTGSITPVVAPVSIFASNVAIKTSFSTALLLLLLVAGIGATGFGAWQLSWGKKQ